uniref:WRKY19-like zinc finger domain-containing protein n=1 Tax=Globisporangium ultimum (strain ATCC 200006 / CBS 805.95 / DAOM BR144) TaxID=431595 RepID=K3WJ59_GLOUD
MFDARTSSHPDSPVDTSMLPPLYASDTAMDGWLHMTSSRPSLKASALPSLAAQVRSVRIKTETPVSSAAMGECVVYDCELEPFEYRPGLNDHLEKSRSLSTVFGDQDLVDAIMCSLDGEPIKTPRIVRTKPPTPLGAHMLMDASLAAAMSAPLGKMTISIPTSSIKMPCTRKPGTFLNKDGRWIKGKPCHKDNCDKRAQSNGLCKGHGGGARCNFDGCAKSSQGGGFCRAHGGGKRCLHEGCEKGTQRNGYCYLHGGVRSCTVEGCDKKDRGNGKCFSHGGGRKCQSPLCFNTIRRGVFCDSHNSKVASK